MAQKKKFIESKAKVSNDTEYRRQAREIMRSYYPDINWCINYVHHIDDNPHNNDISNLKIVLRSEHKSLHEALKNNKRQEDRTMKLVELRNRGFDQSKHIPFTSRFSVSCSQCEALCINGIPTHEHGCPNKTFECRGCNATIEYNGYCQDCQ